MPHGMTPEERKAAIEQQRLEDLHNSRRLRIRAPMYGEAYTLLKLMHGTHQPDRQAEETRVNHSWWLDHRY
jgi:hypothetical protein